MRYCFAPWLLDFFRKVRFVCWEIHVIDQTKIRRASVCLALIISVVSLPVAKADVGAVLQRVPKDAAMVIAISNPNELDKKLAAFVRKCDESADSPGILDQLKKDISVADWVDFSEPMAIVQVTLGGSSKPLAWVRIPSFAEKAKAHEGATNEDGVWRIPLGDEEGKAVFAKEKNGYVILGDSKEALTFADRQGDSFAKAIAPRKEIWAGRDVFVQINVETVRPMALAGIAQASAMAPMIAMMAGGSPGAPDPTVITGAISAVFEAARSLVEQVDYVDAAISINPEALSITLATGYKDGPIKSYLAKQKPGTTSPLIGIEDQPYVFAMSYDVPGKDAPFFDYVMDQAKAIVPKAPSGEGAEVDEAVAKEAAANREAMLAAISEARQLYRMMKGGDVAVSFGSGGMKMIADYVVSDATSFRKLLLDMMTAPNPNALLKLKGFEKIKSLGTKRIGNVDVERFAMSFTEGNPIAAMYGKDASTAIGTVDSKVRLSFGTDADHEKAFAPTIKSPLAESKYVKAALAALPSRRNFVMLVDIAGMMPFMAAMGSGGQVGEIPPGPPVGVSVLLSGDFLRVDINVPSRAIKRVVQASGAQDDS